ncbi:uncharacterized protein [Periplaneta americana]|uniref:uncharacterized protein n=1 Tax=Periplaneta americana TaxID=6978 RepID=UPI0037E81295
MWCLLLQYVARFGQHRWLLFCGSEATAANRTAFHAEECYGLVHVETCSDPREGGCMEQRRPCSYTCFTFARTAQTFLENVLCARVRDSQALDLTCEPAPAAGLLPSNDLAAPSTSGMRPLDETPPRQPTWCRLPSESESRVLTPTPDYDHPWSRTPSPMHIDWDTASTISAPASPSLWAAADLPSSGDDDVFTSGGEVEDASSSDGFEYFVADDTPSSDEGVVLSDADDRYSLREDGGQPHEYKSMTSRPNIDSKYAFFSSPLVYTLSTPWTTICSMRWSSGYGMHPLSHWSPWKLDSSQDALLDGVQCEDKVPCSGVESLNIEYNVGFPVNESNSYDMDKPGISSTSKYDQCT